MTKFTLCAVIVGLSIFGCDNTANRTASTDRTTSPAVQSPASPSSATQMSAADQALAQRVTSSLQADSSLAPAVPNMSVQANNGTVTLNGSVNSQQQRSAIESKVQGITGVTKVVNNLEVASASR